MNKPCGKCGRPVWESSIPRDSYEEKDGTWKHRICPRRARKKAKGRIPKPKTQRYGVNHDLQATGEFRFQNGEPLKDLESVIYRDGRQKFEGADYTARVREVLTRDGGKCVLKVFLPISNDTYFTCGRAADDVDHIVKRSKGRDDRASNLRSLCRPHHDLRHKEFRTRFSGSKR